MHVSSCLHPVRVFNKYSNEYVYAPCGKCAACQRAHSLQWVQRLTSERYCWKYCVFFTLTYDNDNVPTLKCDRYHTHYYDLSHKHYHPIHGDVMINVDEDVCDKIDDINQRIKLHDWLDKNDTIYYLSVGDAQRFIKRLRITIERKNKVLIKKAQENGQKIKEWQKDTKIRYYLCGEYGETTLRPHYHGILFFNSEFTASYISDYISTCWTFGRCDSSFVADCNASYVASYCNCNANLPQILLHQRIKPFSIFSKHPFIGSLCHNSKETKEIFFSATPQHVIFDHKKGIFSNVPLWLSYQRKLYPKLSGFSSLSRPDRIALYGAFERFNKITYEPNFTLFVDYIYGRLPFYTPSVYTDYAKKITLGCTFNERLNPLLSWYYTSMRVCNQAASFGISVRMYVDVISKFYNNVEQLKLKSQYEFEQKELDEGNLVSAFALNREFVRTCLDCQREDLSPLSIELLKGMNIDVDKFYSDDDTVRSSYRYSVHPENTHDFEVYELDSEIWIKKHIKNKRKNDYLAAHPELGNVLWVADE